MIGVAAFYKTRPSQLLGIENTYEAYCFDEACALIQQKIKDGEEPVIPKEEKVLKHYATPSQMYKKFEN